MSNTSFLHRIRIWDLPTRVFHILLTLVVAGLIGTGEAGGDAMQWHFLLGYAVLVLVLFRLVWGVVGGHWSRFVNFVPSPTKLWAFVQFLRVKQASHSIGHNPLGALSVVGMLTVLLLQAVSGLMSDDEIANTGPWVALVPADWVSFATQYHGEIGKVLLILLVFLHVTTVLFYKHVKKDDLITPMLTGDKVLPAQTPDSRDTLTSRLFALSIAVGCIYIVYRLVSIV